MMETSLIEAGKRAAIVVFPAICIVIGLFDGVAKRSSIKGGTVSLYLSTSMVIALMPAFVMLNQSRRYIQRLSTALMAVAIFSAIPVATDDIVEYTASLLDWDETLKYYAFIGLQTTIMGGIAQQYIVGYLRSYSRKSFVTTSTLLWGGGLSLVVIKYLERTTGQDYSRVWTVPITVSSLVVGLGGSLLTIILELKCKG